DAKIRRAKVRYPISPADANNPAAWATMDDKHVLLSDATGSPKPIGIVSDRFQIVQPRAFRDLAERLCGVLGGRVVACFTLHGGAGLVAVIEAGESIRIVGSDIIKPFSTLSTRNDGTDPT